MRSASKTRLQTSGTRSTQCSKFCEHAHTSKSADPLQRAAITFWVPTVQDRSVLVFVLQPQRTQQQRTSSSTAVSKQQLHRESTVFE
jgi:hypothetical protein